MDHGIITNPSLVISYDVRKLCVRPYPGHVHGCPNWNRKVGCPPKSAPLESVIDMHSPTFIVWTRFPLGKHVAHMRQMHPEWSDRQVRCCLYWQGTARKILKERVRAFKAETPNLSVLYCPEAHGLNVTETMVKHGIVLEWPPEEYAYQVALLGARID